MATYKDPDNLVVALNDRAKTGNLRQLEISSNQIDFWSNDYLGYSKLDVEDTGSNIHSGFHGSTGSRLISGNSRVFLDFEAYLATYHRSESALVFNSGYNANLGLMSCVPRKGDLVLFDELIHASLYDGIRQSHAKHFKFSHNDLSSLEGLVERYSSKFKNVFIVVESVYSMDGDVAPLKDFIEIKKNYSNLYFVVDEAHALGTIGGRGAGLVDELGLEDKVFARVFTYGKSLGCHGAAVIGSQILVDYLVNFSRPLIYTTALPDSAVLRIRHSYSWLERGLNFSELQKNIGYFKSKTNGVLNFLDSDTPIQSLVCGSNDLANRIEMELRSKGFNVKGIKSPTVRIGSERIRFCIHSYNTKSQIDNLFEVLTEAVN